MKRWITLVFFGVTLGLFLGCSSTKSAEATALKNRQFEALKELVAGKSFAITVETAYPIQSYAVTQITNALLRNTGNSAGRISLSGSGNYIQVKGDTLKGGLAYYGEMRMVNSLNPRDAGINFEGKPYVYKVVENGEKQTIKLEFDIRTNTEQFSVIMQLYPNKRAAILINSINRTSIRYDGRLTKLKEKEIRVQGT